MLLYRHTRWSYLKPRPGYSLCHTGDLKAGFTPGCSWGYACGVTFEPQGVTSMLSPGTYGHGGAFGTQAWIDPVRGVAYILMIQRSNLNTSYRNNDDTAIRNNFQQAALDAPKEQGTAPVATGGELDTI